MNPRLVKIMNEELNALELLLNLLENQYNLLVSIEKDVVKINQILEEIDLVIKDIANYEIEKKQILQGKSLCEVIEKYNDEEVNGIYSKTLSLLDVIAMQTDTNNVFLKQQLFFTKSMIRAITPKRNAEVYDSYGKIKK